MSDAFTDIARDERRARLVDNYTRDLISYLEGNLSKKKLRERAKTASGGRHGYWSGPRDFITDFDKNLRSLKRGGKTTWGKLLLSFQNSHYLGYLFTLSPWYKKASVVIIDYGFGFICNYEVFARDDGMEVTIPEAEELIRAKDWIVRFCDKYLVAVSKTESRVYWLGNTIGFGCSDGACYSLIRPRKKKDWTGWGTVEQRERYCKKR